MSFSNSPSFCETGATSSLTRSPARAAVLSRSSFFVRSISASMVA